VQGWITNASVLQAVASKIGTSPPPATDGEAGRRSGTTDGQPPDPLPGYQVLEFTVRSETAAARHTLGSISLPAGSIPVSVLRDRILREPDPDLILAAGDRVSVLTPASGASSNTRQAPHSDPHVSRRPEPAPGRARTRQADQMDPAERPRPPAEPA